MNISMIVGSPRPSGSTSAVLASVLKSRLEGKAEIREYLWNKYNLTEETLKAVVSSDAIVFVFSLYIDSIPSHLLRCLVDMEKYVKANNMAVRPKVYVLLNNGFYEGHQNINAIRNMESWCRHCGFEFCNGAGIGGGGMLGMINSFPEEHGPMKIVQGKIKEIASLILAGEAAPISFTVPNYPGFLYIAQAQMGWRSFLRQNGLKRSDITRKMV